MSHRSNDKNPSESNVQALEVVREAIRDLIWEHDVPDDPDHGHHQDWQGYNEEDRAAYIEWAKRVEAAEEGPGKFGPCRPLPAEGLAANMEMIRTGRASYEMLYPPEEGFCPPEEPMGYLPASAFAPGDGKHPLPYCSPEIKREKFKEFLTEAVSISINNVAHEAAAELARPWPDAVMDETDAYTGAVDLIAMGVFGIQGAKAGATITKPIASKGMRNVADASLRMLGKPPKPPGASMRTNLIPKKKTLYDKFVKGALQTNRGWARRFANAGVRTPLRFAFWITLSAYVGFKFGTAFAEVIGDVWNKSDAVRWESKFKKKVENSSTVRVMIDQMTNMAFQKGEMWDDGQDVNLNIKEGTVSSWGISLSEELEGDFGDQQMPFTRRVIWTLMGLVQVDWQEAFWGSKERGCGFSKHEPRLKRQPGRPGVLPSQIPGEIERRKREREEMV